MYLEILAGLTVTEFRTFKKMYAVLIRLHVDRTRTIEMILDSIMEQRNARSVVSVLDARAR